MVIQKRSVPTKTSASSTQANETYAETNTQRLAEVASYSMAELAAIDSLTGVEVKTFSGLRTFLGQAYSSIWDNNSEYFLNRTAATLGVASGSAFDAFGNLGAEKVDLVGLDGSFNEVSETLNMNGTTQVLTSNTYLRLNEFRVSQAGVLNANLSNISCYETATLNNLGVIQSIFNNGMNPAYTVPAGKTFILKDMTFVGTPYWDGVDGKPRRYGIEIRRTYGDNALISRAHWWHGSANMHITNANIVFEEKSFLRFDALGFTSTNTLDISFSASGILVDNIT